MRADRHFRHLGSGRRDGANDGAIGAADVAVEGQMSLAMPEAAHAPWERRYETLLGRVLPPER